MNFQGDGMLSSAKQKGFAKVRSNAPMAGFILRLRRYVTYWHGRSGRDQWMFSPGNIVNPTLSRTGLERSFAESVSRISWLPFNTALRRRGAAKPERAVG
jgi:hypothetical protein